MASNHDHLTDHDLVEDHDRGLAFDLHTLVDRRRALLGLGAAGLVALVGCGSSGGSSAAATSTTAAAGGAASTTGGAAAGSTIPEETAGPYPGDGSNGPDVLSQDGIVRRDLTTSFGDASGTATGVPLTIELVVQDASSGAARAGMAVYAWHCDREGRYSLYSAGAEDQNYLRGVQPTASSGAATFTSIFPAAYDGRWPHIHFEVYEGIDGIATASPLHTSQIALPKDTCDLVYATSGYEASVANLARVSLETDMVFADSYQQELGTVTGSVADGFTVTLAVPV